MAITSAGVGSGLDLEGIIKASVDAENLPKIAQLDKRESAVKLQLTALGQIKSDVGALDAKIDFLKDITNFTKRASTVTQPSTGGDLVSVSSTDTATVGNFKISEVSLAQGSRAVSDPATAYGATTDVVSATGGILTFTAGAKTFDVTVAAGATLAELRTAINDQAENFGVSANIINTGGATPSSNLVFTSSETGTGNDLVVSNNITELNNVSTLASGGGTAGMLIAADDAAKDASIKIDGILTTSATNSFADAIQDSTITVLRSSDPGDTADPADSSDFATFNVDTDKETVKKTITEFVDAFNTALSTLSTVILSKTADATARGLKNSLLNQVGSFVSGAGNLQTIYDVGISMDNEGHLKVDPTSVNTLDEAMENSYDDIGTLFAGLGGVGTSLGDTLELYLKSGGIIKAEQDQLTEQVDGIEKDKENHAYRMELFEKRLRQKYASLDVLIAGMRSQGSAITQSLSNLPGFTRDN
jgi:flagellar hook-associated protein 2